MMSMYVPSSGTAKPAEDDYEYQMIIQQLAVYGIPSSGDKETDKVRLEVVERMMEMRESQETSSRDSIPFDDIMNTLNLTITGDLDKDYDTTIDKLDYEIDLAYSDEEKEYYQALKDQVEYEYNISKENSISYYSGASQLGNLNRFMLGI